MSMEAALAGIQGENLIVSTGDIVSIDGSRYRVLGMDDINSTLIQLDTSKTRLSYIATRLLTSLVAVGTYPIEKFRSPAFDVDENNAKFRKRRDIIRDINSRYTSFLDYLKGTRNGSLNAALIQKYGIKSVSTLYSIVRTYAQSGFCEYSLMPRKHNYPDRTNITFKSPKMNRQGQASYILQQEDYDNMTSAVNKYRKQKNGATTIWNAYKTMLSLNYADLIPDKRTGTQDYKVRDYGHKPSFSQFKYYYYQLTDAIARKTIKKRTEVVRNNHRLLPGGKMSAVTHPGDMLELDACEIPVSMIGTYNPGRSIGKPIIYVMKDVYSKAIVAMSVGFGNNSREALCKLFANLAADKAEYCERYGITGLKPEMWPSGFIPQRVRCDRGSDFKSDEFSRILRDLGITLDLVPGASGSLKGEVEAFFHTLQSQMDGILRNHGLISKDDYKPKHKTQAVLNILDINRMCILYVIGYNNSTLKSFTPSIDIEEAGVTLSPAGIWQYGVANCGSPRTIQNLDMYLDSLLMRDKAVINRGGIHYKGLVYYPEDCDELLEIMFRNQNRKTPIEIMYDPNTINYIKCIVPETKEIVRAPLNTRLRELTGLENFTFAMWNAYKTARNSRKRAAIEAELTQEIRIDKAVANIVETAVANNPTKPSAKNIRDSRSVEKRKDALRESITFFQESNRKKALSSPENAQPDDPMLVLSDTAPDTPPDTPPDTLSDDLPDDLPDTQPASQPPAEDTTPPDIPDTIPEDKPDAHRKPEKTPPVLDDAHMRDLLKFW